MEGVERVPPQHLEAEQSALGAMMLDREATAVGIELLKSEDFYRDVHARIFDAIAALFDRNEPVDLITLTDELQRRNCLDDVGGPAYLTTLASSVPTTANMHRYASIVAEKAQLRSLIGAARDIADWAYADEDETGHVIDRAEERLFSVTERRMTRGFNRFGPLVRAAFERLDQHTQIQREMAGLRTGFPDLDRIIGGLAPSSLVVIAGRPSMGKTSLAMNLATHVGTQPDARNVVAIFSLEMSKDQLVEACMCAEAGIDSHKLRLGRITHEDWDKLGPALDRLFDAPIFIDDTPGLTPLEMRAKIRRLKAEHGLSLVVVDHMQLVTYPMRVESRHQEVSAITRQLKHMARELEVPVVVLSQLSRGVERREDKRPILSDLMESGYIEAEADIVAFIYRPEYYRYRKEREDGSSQLVGGPVAAGPGGEGLAEAPRDDTAEIIVAKNRTGPTGVCELVFQGKYRRFANKARGIGPAPEPEWDPF